MQETQSSSETSSGGRSAEFPVYLTSVTPTLSDEQNRVSLHLGGGDRIAMLTRMYQQVNIHSIKLSFTQLNAVAMSKAITDDELVQPGGYIRFGVVPEYLADSSWGTADRMRVIPHMRNVILSMNDAIVQQHEVSRQVLDNLELDLAKDSIRKSKPVVILCNMGYSRRIIETDESESSEKLNLKEKHGNAKKRTWGMSHDLGFIQIDVELRCSGVGFGI